MNNIEKFIILILRRTEFYDQKMNSMKKL